MTHDCLRCGRKEVIDERDFCINCLNEFNKIEKPIMKDLKKRFINNWNKKLHQKKIDHWTICEACGSEAKRLWITFEDLKQLLKDDETKDVRKHFLHYNEDGLNLYLGYVGYSKNIYDKIKYMKE